MWRRGAARARCKAGCLRTPKGEGGKRRALVSAWRCCVSARKADVVVFISCHGTLESAASYAAPKQSAASHCTMLPGSARGLGDCGKVVREAEGVEVLVSGEVARRKPARFYWTRGSQPAAPRADPAVSSTHTPTNTRSR